VKAAINAGCDDTEQGRGGLPKKGNDLAQPQEQIYISRAGATV
jgi:hypothetical protein